MARELFGQALIDDLSSSLIAQRAGDHALKRGGEAFALRSILHLVPASVHGVLLPLLTGFLNEGAGAAKVQATKAILFDKTQTANWNLRWHQDLTISLKEKLDIPGYGPWSTKVGVPHVQPPLEVMQSILAARIHLDPCGEDNGALNVLPGSHLYGKLEEDAVQKLRQEIEAVCLACSPGDVIFMRPLLLHSSKKAMRPEHRRVLHIEYSNMTLPSGLAWGG